MDLFVINHIAPLFYRLLYMSVTGLCVGVVVMLVRKVADGHISPFWKRVMWLVVLAALVVSFRFRSDFALLNGAESVQEIQFRNEELALRQSYMDYKTTLQQ